MAMIVAVDLNGQKAGHALALAQFLEMSEVKRVMLFGSFGYLQSWTQRLIKHYSDAQSIELKTTEARRSETTILMTAALVKLAFSEPSTLQDDWLIISNRSGFKSLAEELSGWGVKKARWAPAPTYDLFKSILSNDQSEMGPVIYEIAQKVMESKGRQPVLVGAMANILTDMIPDLKDPELRDKLFGSRKFKNIFECVGLKVKGQHLHPLSNR
jgi:hypothetical protein